MIFLNPNCENFPFEDAKKLYEDNKKYFLPQDITFETLLQGLQGNIWAVIEDNKFIGLIYFEVRNNKWFLSGVSNRKMYKYITQAITELCNHYFNYWDINDIFSETEFLNAKIALKKAGFFNIENNLFVKERGL
jgi:hypothetical protein